MVISPVLRGLFGLEWDAPNHSLTVTPHLPATWGDATIRRLPFGEKTLDLTFRRDGERLLVRSSDSSMRLLSHIPEATVKNGELAIPLPAVEVAITASLPEVGAETQQMKVLADHYQGRSLTLELAAAGGSTQTLSVRENVPLAGLATRDGDLGAPAGGLRPLQIHFPAGAGYTEKTVTLNW